METDAWTNVIASTIFDGGSIDALPCFHELRAPGRGGRGGDHCVAIATRAIARSASRPNRYHLSGQGRAACRADVGGEDRVRLELSLPDSDRHTGLFEEPPLSR